MARTCVCGQYFEVTDDGELCLKPGSTGLQDIVFFRDPGTYQFRRDDYPWLARVRVRAQGGGGGSAGATSGSGTLSAQPGAAGGVYAEALLDVDELGDVETVVVGAGGTGSPVNTLGGPGGTSSFGGLVIAPGGPGGNANVPAGSGFDVGSGVESPSDGVGDLVIPGGPGAPSVRYNGTYGMSGAGGDSVLGHGGRALTVNGVGRPPVGYGAGAAGSFSAGGGTYLGAAGGPGIVIVELYA